MLGNGIDEHAKNKSERNEVVIAGYLGKASRRVASKADAVWRERK